MCCVQCAVCSVHNERGRIRGLATICLEFTSDKLKLHLEKEVELDLGYTQLQVDSQID